MAKATRKKHSYHKGRFAEIYAAAYLMLKGYRILAWRHKTPVGEVDLIARKAGMLIAVEVKARQTQSEALHAVRPKAQERIQRALQWYVAQNQHLEQLSLRFDVVAVYGGYLIRHLDNAWMARA